MEASPMEEMKDRKTHLWQLWQANAFVTGRRKAIARPTNDEQDQARFFVRMIERCSRAKTLRTSELPKNLRKTNGLMCVLSTSNDF
jgi:hypothetical protein